MLLTIKDTGGFQSNKTLVWPEHSRQWQAKPFELELVWAEAQLLCLVWPKASLRALYLSHES